MLRELEIANLGIIDSLILELNAGFTVFTGETGAGKSLLVQSLQLLAGERAGADMVRSGSNALIVRGSFVPPASTAFSELLAELGVTESEELVVRREVSTAGRSRGWLNDVPVTMGALQRVAPHLVAIQGQHEQRGLADPATHLSLVDAAGGLEGLRDGVGAAWSAWSEVRERLLAQRQSLLRRRDRLDTIAFQLQEIDGARLTPGEDETLREERAWLRHAERVGELLAAALSCLGEEGGTVAMARAEKAVRELEELGLPVAAISAGLEQARVLAEDAERELAAMGEKARFDPPRLEVVEARLAVIERLARKYGGSLAAVLDHRVALLAEQEELASVEEDIARLEEEEGLLSTAFLVRARELSARREEAGAEMARAVEKVLGQLGMARVRLTVRLERPDGGAGGDEGVLLAASADGIDIAELWIVTNPGEEARPMARIASGGELSRIHLAIRTVLRERQGEEELLLLFDEVDAGIGGQVAEELGRLLAELGRRDQVVVVTHLPQVACCASSHVVVSKVAAAGRTVTRLQPVVGEGRIDEVVRMLGGGPETPSARQHARELLGSP